VALSQGPSGTDSGSALQVRSDRSLLSGKGRAPITARSPDIASLIRATLATLARSRLVMVASSALQGTARVQSERSPLRCRRHAWRLNHQLGGALPSAALLDVVGLPKDERSRVGERGDVVPSFNTMGRLSLAAQPRSVGWRAIAFPLTHCLGFRPERVAHLIGR
jgi:hypothetical protein